ncbi:hypothetical protein G7K_5938-t1 [Saitoella complicata NRRL Y-17804]|uniref:Uncharacterized protein n=1 Tax=Saitoella complicata (strain BCRC 22490 / CBS 7301 / JCM 7358 / NBRC 10748 / NRRL Y-17804) TaxID=698492 RepID=A0A0E9NPN7_SAICN|nr:hypothetical protein G7K_5938-t1 [Saitoella complicata NRRL Y-17804]
MHGPTQTTSLSTGLQVRPKQFRRRSRPAAVHRMDAWTFITLSFFYSKPQAVSSSVSRLLLLLQLRLSAKLSASDVLLRHSLYRRSFVPEL